MLKEVLDAREARWNRRLELVEKFRLPLLTFTLNIPGPDKTGEIFVKVHKKILGEILTILKRVEIPVVYTDDRMVPAGPEAFVVADAKAARIKGLMISVEENHPAGRIMDLDVMDADGACISRSDIGLPQRKCILCQAPATECIALKRHERSEILAKVMEIAEEYLERDFS